MHTQKHTNALILAITAHKTDHSEQFSFVLHSCEIHVFASNDIPYEKRLNCLGLLLLTCHIFVGRPFITIFFSFSPSLLKHVVCCCVVIFFVHSIDNESISNIFRCNSIGFHSFCITFGLKRKKKQKKTTSLTLFFAVTINRTQTLKKQTKQKFFLFSW